ncbi:MAG: hypothetical protein KJ923_03085 [Candidatus Omnitrophica bacterium]|nr:hypothetical protein [Candidatus Omnitrophota bacterium]MBU1905965.1 hypothetical protein [Candidatus Omnitrophota bacterium]
MRTKVIAVLAVIFLLGVCFVSGSSLAQEQLEPDFSSGVVVSVLPETIVVKEYNYDSAEEADVTYALDEESEINNVDSLEDIVVGDTVTIEYLSAEGNYLVKSITLVEVPVEEVASEIELMPEENLEEQLENIPQQPEGEY